MSQFDSSAKALLLSPSRYPGSEIEHMWKLVCLNQFHDCLPGSAIEIAYDDVHKVIDTSSLDMPSKHRLTSLHLLTVSQTSCGKLYPTSSQSPNSIARK
jgi:hypothetical protein